MHLNDDRIQRFLHDELDERAKELLSLHVAGCNACAQRLAEAEQEEREIFGLLTRLDHPASNVDASTLVGRERAVGSVWGRRVAIIVVAVALAGAVYAIPGSPLPALLKRVADLIASQNAPPTDEPPSPPAVSGIAVPVQPRFTIVFEGGAGSNAAISLVDGTNVAVRALGGSAAFTTDVDRITVDNLDAATNFEVEIPRDAPFVEILIGARRVVVKDGANFAHGLTTDARGRAVLPLTTQE